jgi:hypothetical protein
VVSNKEQAPRRPLWLITRHGDGRMHVLILDPNGEEEALSVFSYEEEAEAFLSLQEPGEAGKRERPRLGSLSLCSTDFARASRRWP